MNAAEKVKFAEFKGVGMKPKAAYDAVKALNIKGKRNQDGPRLYPNPFLEYLPEAKREKLALIGKRELKAAAKSLRLQLRFKAMIRTMVLKQKMDPRRKRKTEDGKPATTATAK